MSNLHITADVRDHQATALFTTAVEVAVTVRATVRAFAMRNFASIERHFVQRRLIRLSDHMLRDLGFERDWDGEIRSLRDVD